MPNPQTARLLKALQLLGDLLDWPREVEVLLVGGFAGVITGVLPSERTTADCDVAKLDPAEATNAVKEAAAEVARKLGLRDDWFSDQVAHLNVLPDAWRSRRRAVGRFGKLHVYAVGRLDLLAMKVFAHRRLDRMDLDHMQMSADEADFVRKYLRMLKVPSRKVDLDQVQGAERYLKELEEDRETPP
jgi:hypothetical protein